MTFTHQELRLHLAALGIPTYFWQLPDTDFETVADDYLPEVWDAWIGSLRLNAPQCLEPFDLGGGKTRMVPRWKEGAGDCENIAVLVWAHLLQGEWMSAVAGGPLRGRAAGITFFKAIKSPENYLDKSTPHCVMWIVNHEGHFRPFECGVGFFVPWTPAEYASAVFGIAA